MYPSSIYLLLNSSWNLLQNRPCSRSQCKCKQIQKNYIIPCILSEDNE